jgi:TubC N-terminal docking domain
MSAINLLSRLRDAGLKVAANGDALVIGPRDLLTDELRAAIRSHKCELLAELPRYRWRIVEVSGEAKEVCCLPEMTAAEVLARYSGAQVRALPDGVTP